MLNSIPAELHEPSQIKTLNQDSTASHPKALGVFWDAHNDIFYVLAPANILMKVLLQRLWEIKTGWDEEVPHNLQQRHSIWCQQLPCFSKFPFKRFYFFPGGVISCTELHGFSDASEHAPPSLTLVTAKTKVAPLKRLSIPRLELCGTNLLSKLINNVRHALKMDLSQVVAWSDSTIVLHWLDGNPRRFKTFVGNRVANILELLPSAVWKHVPISDNPAGRLCI